MPESHHKQSHDIAGLQHQLEARANHYARRPTQAAFAKIGNLDLATSMEIASPRRWEDHATIAGLKTFQSTTCAAPLA